MQRGLPLEVPVCSDAALRIGDPSPKRVTAL
jgi:hypothetical protein